MPDRDLLREILQRSGEHLLLVAIAIALALLIALPLGVTIARRPRWAAPVLTLANVVQTIPSLAIFGMLITVPLVGGLGARPAIVALTLYALLPLLRGVSTGLAQVPAGVKEAARALGLNHGQVLRRIELPLALPTLMAGLRVATVISVGVATIAAAIGAGGLGVFIFRGIATVNNGLILAGALPAAAIALLADAALGTLERCVAGAPTPERASPRGRRRRILLLTAGLALAALLGGLAAGSPAGWFGSPAAGPTGGTIRIGSKNFTEQLILGELLAQQIEAETSLQVTRDFGLGGTFLCQEAVRSGRIAGYVEYSGTAWTAVLGQPPPTAPAATHADPADTVFSRARALYASRFGLTMFPSLGFENSFAILVREGDAERLGLRTISEAAAHTPLWRAGFGYEFLNRADGFPGLARRYGLRFAAPPVAMDLGLTYRALAQGTVDLIAGDSTNGLIPALNLRVLRDDRRYFPPYEAVPVFHTATLRRHPELAVAIEGLAGRLDATAMQRLNAAVDLHKQPVEAVVRRWRVEQGLAPRDGTGLNPAASAPGSSS
jgi:osmoprotectant transport system permease protein